MTVGQTLASTAADTGRARRRRVPPFGVLLAGAGLLVLLIAAAVPSVFAADSEADPVNALLGPSGAHWFGTDQLGRDVFARVVHGARYSIAIGLGATVLAVVVGSLLGLLSALGGRVVDQVLMRVVDIMLAFPELLLALVVVVIIGPGPVNALLAIGVAGVPSYARLVRSQALIVRRSGYVEAAVAMGLRRGTLVRRHVLPNTLGPVLVLATIGVGTAIIAGSALSFLGLGPKQPTPEWGSMLADGRDFLDSAWWVAVFPGAAITLTVVCVTVVGRYLQARFEGRT